MNPIIIALDCESSAEARAIVQATCGAVAMYKIGLELYAAAGMEFVRALIADGHEIFLDLKLHDIGETVRRATARIAASGVRLLTVHAEPQVMRAAVAASRGTRVRILGVTILTSLDQTDLHAMGYAMPMGALFERRVRNGIREGVDGFVCSPLEVAAVRAWAGPDAVLVTPGVRSAGAAKGDQKRVSTPAEAIEAGANFIVVGRQVTRAPDPKAELERIHHEIRAFPSWYSDVPPSCGV
jgi:orotidine-5'-phosphate decarboxylase